ncbi:MAG: YceI family protein [Crocinitomicaceae bacterium]|nr:YceI family protein [Crocinitomicaceae bacterium]
MKKLIFAFIATSFLITSCSSEEKKEDKSKEKKEENKESAESCTYSISPDNIVVNFTAYKFAEPNKTGVNGKFEEITISGNNQNVDPMMAATGVQFEIPVASVYTGDPARDKKIRESFFGTMMATEKMTGSVRAIEGDQVTIELKMNEITFDVVATQVIDGENITLNAEINTDNWNGQDAISALNKVCEANHKSPEGGASVLWPDVTLKIEGKLIKECK